MDAVPQRRQPEMTAAALQRIAAAEPLGRVAALQREFVQRYGRLVLKAVERLERDWERLVDYDAFPQEHWQHLRTTNVIESPFDAVRLPT